MDYEILKGGRGDPTSDKNLIKRFIKDKELGGKFESHFQS